jgi:hypothetical protein
MMENDITIQKNTIVTGFFDIGREKWGHSSRSIREYLENAKTNLSININMIIFIEKLFEQFVKHIRRNLLDKTYIIIMKKEELPKYYLRETIKNIMDSNEFKKDITCPKVPEMWNPDYNIITWSKTDLLHKAIEINPFVSTHFCWMDFGLGSYAKIDKIPRVYSDKLKLLCRSMPQQSDLDRKKMCKSHTNRFAAGFLTGRIDYLLWFINAVDEEIKKCIGLGVVDCEQTMWSNVYLENRDKFELYFGDWNEIIVGY